MATIDVRKIGNGTNAAKKYAAEMKQIAEKQGDHTAYDMISEVQNLQRDCNAALARGVNATDLKASTAIKLRDINTRYKAKRDLDISAMRQKKSEIENSWQNTVVDNITDFDIKKMNLKYGAMSAAALEKESGLLSGIPLEATEVINPYRAMALTNAMRARGLNEEAENFIIGMESRSYDEGYKNNKEYKTLDQKIEYFSTEHDSKIRVFGGAEVNIEESIQFESPADGGSLDY
jgi:hypothetical protein